MSKQKEPEVVEETVEAKETQMDSSEACEEMNSQAEENKNDELEELRDKLLRQMAEFDNYRKRTIKEKDAAYGNGVCDAIAAVLPAVDNLERAYTAALDSDKAVAEGISMVLKQFDSIFDSLGISEIEALNQKFDHNLHNAVMHVEDEQYGEDEVIEVFKKGYKMDDRVIRHSTVKVAN